ncbi:succinyl-diaminopimelate desuccinylase [Dietzia sp. SL131]|uniref:succinyl-diaminopimelate desuccinylase n=1 Tax=Dietzia sp. SL131 TaxID=2995149 RepID=UPI00227D6DE6|nr:succinyl-diaminopimelate desuccinylase [Dietzia sp. SL131]MCY1657282.1 succinyl-diaminopimelate desuccinylase [Dietzia sp. SL131]
MRTTRVGAVTAALDLTADPVDLTRALVDIPSPSREEDAIAAAVHDALVATVAGFTGPAADRTEVVRDGNRVLARTSRGLPTRVVLAGHLDTVPLAHNVPCRVTGEGTDTVLHGCGTVDMKSGDAVFLHLFAALADSDELAHDLTLVLYDCEEIEATANGLGVLERTHRDWLTGDVAILGEPTGGLIEAGCQGTLRIRVHARGVRAHSARSWLGDNAVHRLAPVLGALAAYEARSVDIDGCVYREGLQAVRMSAGVAGNTVPDEAWLDVNFRSAPDRDTDAALAHALDALGLTGLPRVAEGETPPAEPGLYWELTDLSPGALPGLGAPAAAELVRAAGGRVRAKYGWTDVSRFAALGIPAVNLGPGDPGMAHKRDEYCPAAQITEVGRVLRTYLTG